MDLAQHRPKSVDQIRKTDRARGFFINGGFDEQGFPDLAQVTEELSSFMDRFSPLFKTSKSNLGEQAAAYVGGLFLNRNRNIERISEDVPGFRYHQMHHFLSCSPWDDSPIDHQIGSEARALMGGGPVGLIIDPTGFPKKGRGSVGVGRQWLGRLGKTDNGQVAVTAALVNGRDTCLIDKELYLPESWVKDEDASDKVGIPQGLRTYRPRLQIARDMIAKIDERDIGYDWIGMDAEFGSIPLLHELDDMGKTFVVDVRKTLTVYRQCPIVSWRKRRRKGRRTRRIQRLRFKPKPLSLERLVDGRRWRRIFIRDSAKGRLTVEVQTLRVWVSDSNLWKGRCYHLIIRRQRGANQTKIKYSLSNAAPSTSIEDLAFMQGQRFWVEHAIKESKQTGLGDYQVRTWRAWHHHFTLTMLAGLFMLEMRMKHRERFPLLTCGDIRTLLFALLPRKTDDPGEVLDIVRRRHARLAATMIGCFRE